MHIPTFVSTALLAVLVVAHPGHDHTQELKERAEFLSQNKNDLSHCAAKMRARGFHASNIKRRNAFAGNLLKKRGMEGREAFTPSAQKSHESLEEYTVRTDPSVLFAGNASCVLSPEQIEGPYYVAGEYIRQDITDDEAGIPLAVDIQIVDMDTCLPIPDVYLEIWHCNSTGVYGGVVAQGNGNTADMSNLNNTMFRGAQKTDKDGAVQFHTMFPGHYIGRTTHIHVAVHLNATAQPNGTIMDLTAAHVGQIYFDQDLINAVEKTSPYADNTQPLTTNAQDFLLQQANATSDPFLEYVFLGGGQGDVAGGLMSWISFGINVTLAREMSAASTLYAEGGKQNPNSGGGGPGGGFPGGGFPPGFTFPPGAFPPGFPTGGFPTAGPLPTTGGLPTAEPLPTASPLRV